MNNFYLKTFGALVFSFLLTQVMVRTVFFEDRAQLRDQFAKTADKIASPIIGSGGEPIKSGVDPTPPKAVLGN